MNELHQNTSTSFSNTSGLPPEQVAAEFFKVVNNYKKQGESTQEAWLRFQDDVDKGKIKIDTSIKYLQLNQSNRYTPRPYMTLEKQRDINAQVEEISNLKGEELVKRLNEMAERNKAQESTLMVLGQADKAAAKLNEYANPAVPPEEVKKEEEKEDEVLPISGGKMSRRIRRSKRRAMKSRNKKRTMKSRNRRRNKRRTRSSRR